MKDIKCFFCGSKTINTLLENTHGLGSIYTVCENEKCGACVPVTKWEEHKSELDRLKQENDRLKQNQAKLIEALKPFKEVGDCVDIDFDYVEVVVGNKYKNKGKDFADNFIKAKEVYDRSVKSED